MGEGELRVSEDTLTTGEELPQVAAVNNEDELTQQSDQAKQVPLSALESERAKRQNYEEENRLLKENYELLKAQQPTQSDLPPKKDDYDSLEDDDIMTVRDFKKISSKMKNQFSSTVEELKMAQRHPDYQEVISKFLPEVIKTNPKLRETLQQTQDYELAYYLAKNSDSYRNSVGSSSINEKAERIIKNSQASSGLSSVGSSTPVNQAKRYKDMSDQDFKILMERNRE